MPYLFDTPSSQNTSIPVPQVFDVNEDRARLIGFPFLLMEFIDANSAEDVAARQGAPWGMIPDRFELHFWRQIAGVMVELASIRAPRIGSIAAGSTKSQILLAPLSDSRSGPYSSRSEFYDDYAVALGRQFGHESIKIAEGELVRRFREFADRHCSDTLGSARETDFGLAHFDLSPSNVLVDDEFNIKAVIDWDSIYALPRAALHFLPKLMSLDCQPPGLSPKYDIHDSSMQRAFAFSRVVEQVAREYAQAIGHRGEERPLLFTSAEFFSREAIAFRLVERVKFGQNFACREGAAGLLWMENNTEEEIRQYHGI